MTPTGSSSAMVPTASERPRVALLADSSRTSSVSSASGRVSPSAKTPMAARGLAGHEDHRHLLPAVVHVRRGAARDHLENRGDGMRRGHVQPHLETHRLDAGVALGHAGIDDLHHRQRPSDIQRTGRWRSTSQSCRPGTGSPATGTTTRPRQGCLGRTRKRSTPERGRRAVDAVALVGPRLLGLLRFHRGAYAGGGCAPRR